MLLFFLFFYLLPAVNLTAAAHSHSRTNNINHSYTVAIFQPALVQRSTTTFICSGVLISPNKVLTIAECVTDLVAYDISIRTGTTPSTYQNISVASILPCPAFDMDALSNDLAIIHLAENVSATPAVLKKTITTTSPAILGNVTLVSWGSMTNTSHAISPTLKTTREPVVGTDACKTKLASCYPEFSSSQHFCTQVTAEWEAYGDAGGPVLDSATGELVGLISGNPECAGPNHVALQVNLSTFGQWIASTTATS